MRLGTVKSKFFPVMLCISVLLCVLSVAIYYTDAFSFFFDAVGVVLTPVEKLTTAVSTGAARVTGYFSDIDALRRENESLREENARLLSKEREDVALREENKWLRQFLELKRERTDLSLTDAKIVARDVGFISSFTLDKGSLHGLEENMPIITEKGLLGVVTEVGVSTARGMSLINYNASVGVYMERTMTSAVLTGSFDLAARGLCKVINLPADTDVVVGDIVYTSGYGSVYPKDIVVGTVVSVEPNPSNYTISAIVMPAADMSLSDYVMIVTDSETVYE